MTPAIKKLIFFIILVVAALLLGRVVSVEKPRTTVPEMAQYTAASVGLSFTYPTGPQGYAVSQQATLPANGALTTITLTPVDPRVPVGGEAPASITINVFDNTDKLQPNVWAMKNGEESGLARKRTEPVEAVVGGANAVRFMADGLYASEQVVVAHAGYIYVFSGEYLAESSVIRDDFVKLIESVTFVPTGIESTAKLNIDVVCTSALAYMTFPDGAAADAFVADCKEGKHPEVIERYKKDIGLGDGAAV